jgi:hypothetical protein
MIEQMVPNMSVFCQSWASIVTSLVWGQWIMLDTGLRTAQAFLQAVTAAPGVTGPPRTKANELISRARERMRKGLAPPREIYQAPYRDRIDWSLFPDWARPNDPEMYEGCGHEG